MDSTTSESSGKKKAKGRKMNEPAKTWRDKARRKKRITYTAEQLEVLMREYEISQTPSAQKLNEIADELGFESLGIKNWFANRRQKLRRQTAAATAIAAVSVKIEEPSESFQENLSEED